MNLPRPVLRKPRIEMVPLIDSFFLLLAFFMSSALSMSILKGLPLELPSARQAERLQPEDLLVVTVTKDGHAQLDGDAVTLEQMVVRLRAVAKASTLRVAVRADRVVPTGRLVEVLDAVRAAGIHRMGLVTDAANGAPP